ncbi:MAG TPA: Na+/H+ antiporter NhaA [Thermoleophilaceae bacterium]|nr:Na+/H+ antiporter NhaA [Thermoleophilaceae bacterium]
MCSRSRRAPLRGARRHHAAALPGLTAAGGAMLPALLFTAILAGAPGAEGWAIPMATDNAFAIGVLALLGDRVSSGQRLFLLAIAVVVAIAVITLFYSKAITVGWLLGALGGLAVIVALRRLGMTSIIAGPRSSPTQRWASPCGFATY